MIRQFVKLFSFVLFSMALTKPSYTESCVDERAEIARLKKEIKITRRQKNIEINQLKKDIKKLDLKVAMSTMKDKDCASLKRNVIKDDFAKKCAKDIERYQCAMDDKCPVDDEENRSFDAEEAEYALSECFKTLDSWIVYKTLKCSRPGESLSFDDFMPPPPKKMAKKLLELVAEENE